METIRNGDVTGSTSYHVTPSRPIRSLENIQNQVFQACLYTTHACVRVRVRVRAWTSSYDAVCVRGRLACVLAGMRSRVDVFLRCRVRAWPSCIRPHVHVCCVRTWTSFYDAACVPGRLGLALTCMRAACVCACVRGRLAFVLTCMRAGADVLACVDVSRVCVDVVMHTCRIFFM